MCCCSVLGQGQSTIVVHHTSPFLPKPNCTPKSIVRSLLTRSVCLLGLPFPLFLLLSPHVSPLLVKKKRNFNLFPHRRRSTPLFPGTCVVLVTHETRNSPMPLWLRNGLDFKTAKGAASDLLLLYHFQDLLPPSPAASAHHFDLVPRATSKPERHTDGGGGAFLFRLPPPLPPFWNQEHALPSSSEERKEDRGQSSLSSSRK